MHSTNFHFYNTKTYLYSKPVKGLNGYVLGYRFGFNGKEKDNEGMGGGGSTYDYGFRIYNAQLGRFLSVDPLTKSYPYLTPYQFASNCPISGVDLDGLEFYYAADGAFLGQGDDKENKEVRLGKVTGKTTSGQNIISAVDLDGNTQSQFIIIHGSIDEFRRLAGVLYAEGSSTLDESAAIYSVLENRAALEKNSVSDQAQYTKGVYGASEAEKINSVNANKDKVKNAFGGLIKGILSETDFSNGAYFWDGKDFNGKNKVNGGYNKRYLPGFKFNDPNDDIWKQGDNIKPGQNKYGRWDYKYESTTSKGKTTFSKLSFAWRDAQLEDKKDKKTNEILEKRCSNEMGR